MPYCEIIEVYTDTIEYCEYGCGSIAQYAFIVKKCLNTQRSVHSKVRKCCSKHYNCCPGKKQAQSAKMQGSGNSMFGKNHKADSIQKMQGPRPSIAGENHPRWGKKFVDSTETRRLKSIASAKSTKAYWKKTLNGRAFNMFFRSSFEMFFIIQNYPNIVSNEGSDPVLINYKEHRHYKPDFFIGKTLIEIKPKFARMNEDVQTKEDAGRLWCQQHGFHYQIITEDDIEFDFDRVENLIADGKITFNNDGLNRFRKMRSTYEKRFKRRP